MLIHVNPISVHGTMGGIPHLHMHCAQSLSTLPKLNAVHIHLRFVNIAVCAVRLRTLAVHMKFAFAQSLSTHSYMPYICTCDSCTLRFVHLRFDRKCYQRKVCFAFGVVGIVLLAFLGRVVLRKVPSLQQGLGIALVCAGLILRGYVVRNPILAFH